MQKFRLDNEIKRVDIERQKKREGIEYIEKEGRCGSMYGKNVRIGEKNVAKDDKEDFREEELERVG